jgi:hypothetical protein
MTINTINCSGGGTANTGVFACELKPGIFRGAILIPENAEYTQTQLAAFDAVLQAAAKADSPTSRIYPIKTFMAMNDNSTEDTTTETGYGNVLKAKDGLTVLEFQLNNGLSSWANLAAFDNQYSNFRVLYMDETNNGILGTQKSNGKYTGFKLNQLSMPNPKWSTGSDPFNFMVTFGHASKSEMENFMFVQFGDDQDVMTVVDGLLEIQPTLQGALSGGGVATITCRSGAQDLYDLYSSNLAQVTAWIATNRATGAAITVSTATVTGGTAKSWDITLDTTDTDYPSSGGQIKLVNAVPSVLEASPILMPGYVGEPIYITVP